VRRSGLGWFYLRPISIGTIYGPSRSVIPDIAAGRCRSNPPLMTGSIHHVFTLFLSLLTVPRGI
jgi:hypothetical protein